MKLVSRSSVRACAEVVRRDALRYGTPIWVHVQGAQLVCSDLPLGLNLIGVYTEVAPVDWIVDDVMDYVQASVPALIVE